MLSLLLLDTLLKGNEKPRPETRKRDIADFEEEK